MGYELQLARLRRSRGMTQRQFAEASGIPLGTVRSWEQGAADVPLDAACRCAAVLGCDVNELCGWYGEHPADRVQCQQPGDPAADELRTIWDGLGDRARGMLLDVARFARCPA